jgi:O-acetyl-ADP-ribose deacetylase (regulator of RNase III)
MEFINGNITDITFGFVCHQVNCQGVMGAGVALAIRKKWPVVYNEYIIAHTKYQLWLGNTIFVNVTPTLCVANLCGQDRYGRTGVYTNYEALHRAIHYVSETRTAAVEKVSMQIPVYFPNGMGCRLAGGDWNVVIQIIGKYIPDAKIINYTY